MLDYIMFSLLLSKSNFDNGTHENGVLMPSLCVNKYKRCFAGLQIRNNKMSKNIKSIKAYSNCSEPRLTYSDILTNYLEG